MFKNMAEGKVVMIPVKPTLNYEQAKALFDAECVFFGRVSGVPVSRVEELFGDKPVKHASACRESEHPAKYKNEFWIEGFRCKYLTREGFYQAVAYANVMRIAQAEGAGMNGLQAKDYHGQTVVDSRDAATMLGRDHNELLKSIRTYAQYLAEGEVPQGEFFIESTYIDRNKQERPCYLITKKGCDMIANKTPGKKGTLFTAAYVTVFEEMSRKISQITAPMRSLASGVSLNGLARLISVTRRVMLDMGSTPVEVGAMTKSLYDNCGIPLPVAFTKQIPGQLCMFDSPALEGRL